MTTTSRMHEVKLVSNAGNFTRLVIADSSVKAMRIALDKLPDEIGGPCYIVCKPLCIFDPTMEEESCTR